MTNSPSDIMTPKEESLTVLQYLNETCGKRFRPLDSTIKYIKARLIEGYKIEDLKKVIDYKKRDPWFIQNPRFLNPETLFYPGKFMRYLDQCENQMDFAGGSDDTISIEERVSRKIGKRLQECSQEERERWLSEFRRMKDGEKSEP